jgi:MscS family membrane protein
VPDHPNRRSSHRALVAVLALGFAMWGQTPALNKAPAENTTSPSPDSLGRSTPRGTVLGFLSAGRRGNFETAVQYLNTRERGPAAVALAEQLYVVLDRRLPPTLTKLSDKQEGSAKDPALPDQEFVGAIRTASGSVNILLERLNRPKTEPIWLFSKETVQLIPELYEQTASNEERVPRLFREARIDGVAVFEWLALLVGLPLAYLATTALGKWLSIGAYRAWRRARPNREPPAINVIPGPVRLLILAGLIKLWLNYVYLPLIAREVWTSAAAVLTIATCVWVAIAATAWIERRIVSRFAQKLLGGAPLVRFVRRALDLLLIFIGVLIGLRYFGVNTTAALAGLGVGGIAVALAAQKTLENVIGGLSLIFDETIQLGDTLKLADSIGTVDAIGLRSTRIRTLDRTILSVPNGQIANATIENLSRRDRFRFLHIVGVEYGTTAAQLRAVLDQITAMLRDNAAVEPESVRVRFIRFASSSLDIEVMAHIVGPGWSAFLEIQEALLFGIIEIVQGAGASIAFPSQTLYVSASVERKRLDGGSPARTAQERSAAVL